jgi:peptidoglycan hydrolase-like protein with peptidoglycan-binding domain
MRSTKARAGAEHSVLQLQQLVGNRAVGALLSVQRGCHCGCGGKPGCVETDTATATEEAGLQRAVTSPPEVPSTAMLAKGSRGPAVQSTQVNLNALGATPQLDPDGNFGSRTDGAVRFFQRSHRLVPDGIVGPATSIMLQDERATKEVNFLVPCHTPEKPGPDGHEEKPLEEQVDGRGGGNLVAAPAAAAKVNLTLVLTTAPQDQDEAAAVGGKIVSVGSIAALKAALDQHPNIGTLAIISHGGSDGTIRIGGDNVFLKDLAAQLSQRPSGSIERVQFLGCNIGRDAAGMGTLKGQVGAGAVEGTNCSLETQRLTPARRGGGKGAEILTPQDLPPSFLPPHKPISKAEFGALLKQLIPGHLDVNNTKIKQPDCILGFGPGTKLATVDPERLADLYFARQGNLVFRFVPGGACWEDLRFDQATDGCQRVQR